MKTFLFLALLLVARFSVAQPTSFSVVVVGKGQPILLIPGYSCSGEVWNETVDHLKDRYECHVLTLPGFAGVPAIKNPVLATVRDEIIQYIKTKKLRQPILMGHSLGAFMSLWVSSREPSLVSKLICVDGVPFISAMMNPATNADSLRKNPMYNADVVAQNFVNLPNGNYETNMVKSMLTQVSDTTRARQIARWSALSDRRTLGYTLVEMSLTDLRNDIARIQSPTLVLGSLYFNSQATSERILTEQYKQLGHKTIAVAQTKHFIMYDDPQWFYQQIDHFLQRAN
ncbi:alpha/beta fold hydrolase [Spirosoma agri]|uniref:Alpha/beta hydrolase n=1 Tax=Spirosoma agri TaxID=1987381 RepID=A0A6M0IBV8_9BACT|nr:alpha/beta hydrolase [Spirosoma agri]NEU65669.1 alpha/beta hydrolase [Spirosoma agri]